MVAPIVAALMRQGIGSLLESNGLPSGLANPKGYVLGKIKSAADSALDLPTGTTSAVTDPKGTAIGVAKDLAKDYLKDKGEVPVEDRSVPSLDTSSDVGGKPVQESYGYSEYKRGGKVKSAAKSMSKASSASRRGDGIAQRGKTRGRMR